MKHNSGSSWEPASEIVFGYFLGIFLEIAGKYLQYGQLSTT